MTWISRELGGAVGGSGAWMYFGGEPQEVIWAMCMLRMNFWMSVEIERMLL